MLTGVAEIAAAITIAKTFEWIWDDFGKDIVTYSAQKIKGQWDKSQFQPAAQKYADDMKKLHGIVHMWRKPGAMIDLEKLYTKAKVHEDLSELRQADPEQLENEYFGETITLDRLDGFEMLSEHDNIFLWGRPGAGKTTFLRHIALQAIHGDLKYVPILVSLREFYESGCTLFDFIVQQFKICDFPDAAPFIEAVLKKGKAIVLCDSLDEVPKTDDKQRKIAQELINFSQEYDDSKFVITCRIAATERFFEKFYHIEMAGFDEEQINEFVKNWFENTENPSLAKERIKEFLENFEQKKNERLYALARNPLLLTLLCIAFQESGRLSTNRSDIYEEAIDALLINWDMKRGVTKRDTAQYLSLRQKRQMFAQIAEDTFSREIYLFEKKFLTDLLKSYLQRLPDFEEESDEVDETELIKAIEAENGIIVQCAQGIYSFSHLTFQEYFTARHIVDNALQGKLYDLIDQHWSDEKWKEVFLLTAQMISNADVFFERFLAKLDNCVRQDPKLLALLKNVNYETEQLKSDFDPFEIRSELMSILVDSVSALSPEAIFFEVNSPLESKDLTSSHRISRRAKKSLLFLESHLAHIISGAQMLVHTPESGARKREYEKIYYAHRQAKVYTEQYNLIPLQQVIDELVLPQQDAPREKWDEFIAAFTKALETNHSLAQYHLTAEQFDRLKAYVLATYLAWDCLQVASISGERQMFKNRLFCPPNS